MCSYTLNKAEQTGKHMSSQDSCHLNVRKSDAKYLDLDPSSRHPQPVFEAMQDSESHSKDMNSSHVSDDEYENVSHTNIPSVDDSGVTGGGQGAECPPETSDREIFADVSGKLRRKVKENCKREGGKLEMEV